MQVQKLNTLLALREKYETSFKNALNDLVKKFKEKQGHFSGERKTYVALEGYADEPTKRNFRKVASTVNEQLEWFEKYNLEYLKQLFSIEKTNAAGFANAELMVDGKNWGRFTSTELLRLKGFLENSQLKAMYDNIPTREEDKIWKTTDEDIYEGREVFEGQLEEGFTKTTLKEQYILPDPHPDQKRPPMVADKNTTVNIGQFSSQQFSGAASMRERAEIMARLDVLHKATVEAIEKANDTDVIDSTLGDQLFAFIHRGEN
jgi:hypothetical protein